MFKGGQEQSFFPSKTLIYGISRDDSKKFNIRTCEHMILGQLRRGARATTYAALNNGTLHLYLSIPSSAFPALNVLFNLDHGPTQMKHLNSEQKLSVELYVYNFHGKIFEILQGRHFGRLLFVNPLHVTSARLRDFFQASKSKSGKF